MTKVEGHFCPLMMMDFEQEDSFDQSDSWTTGQKTKPLYCLSVKSDIVPQVFFKQIYLGSTARKG